MPSSSPIPTHIFIFCSSKNLKNFVYVSEDVIHSFHVYCHGFLYSLCFFTILESSFKCQVSLDCTFRFRARHVKGYCMWWGVCVGEKRLWVYVFLCSVARWLLNILLFPFTNIWGFTFGFIYFRWWCFLNFIFNYWVSLQEDLCISCLRI